MTRIALYPGSFDPLTNGHVDVLAKSLDLFDRVVVAIGIHPSKKPLFSVAERTEMIYCTVDNISKESREKVEIVTFDGLVVDAARRHGAGALVRGLRDATDFDYEMQMSGMNGTMAPGLHTVFLPASPEVRHITATLVRQIAAMGGDVGPFVPSHVLEQLIKKFA